MQQTFLSPAKINLNLGIKDVSRADGFHELETLIAKVNLYDELTFTPADNYQLSFADNTLQLSESDCSIEDNLITQALRLWEQATGLTALYHIHVTKRIPHGAGLGGGSSNAVTTLKALNELNNKPLTDEKLLELANQLGSDMACFMTQGLAQCTGRGDISTPYHIDSIDTVNALKQQSLLLIKPQFGVNSAEAYQLYKKHVTNTEKKCKPEHQSFNFIGVKLYNDLEYPVFIKYPFLAILKDWLNQQPEIDQALMTGSGSTLVAYIKGSNQGHTILQRAQQRIDPTLWGAQVNLLL